MGLDDDNAAKTKSRQNERPIEAVFFFTETSNHRAKIFSFPASEANLPSQEISGYEKYGVVTEIESPLHLRLCPDKAALRATQDKIANIFGCV